MEQKKFKVPFLSDSEIEGKAELVIEYIDKEILIKPQFTPINIIINKLQEKRLLSFCILENLGETNNYRKILGKYVIRTKTILIDSSIYETTRFNFAIAHELGHFVLHRKLLIKHKEYGEQLIDTDYDTVSGKKKILTDRDRLEYQANSFASSLLLPEKTFRKALIGIQKVKGINRNIGKIYVESNHSSMTDYQKMLSELADIYQVNKTNIEYRLMALDMIIDKRLKSVSHISEFIE